LLAVAVNRITLGNETYKTKTLDNAGGSAEFNEKLSFNKQASENVLQVGAVGSTAQPL
jgi:hypothetical protein